MTDDLWMHLALGQAYSDSGLQLTADPHLYTAPGPPAPASWLADLSLHSARQRFGFNGLRILHVATLTSIFALAWFALRHAAGSPAFASVSLALFAAVSAYRLIQLRPELGTIGLLLVLYRLVFAPDSRLVRWKLALVALLCVVWVNIHAAFLLGPMLLFGVSISLALVAGLGLVGHRHTALRERARFLALAGGASTIATLCNPQGFAAHTAYWRAGVDAPDLEIVSDEWRRVNLLDFPVPNLPPSWLSWIVIWILLIAVVLIVVFALRRFRISEIEGRVDPGLLALAIAALIGISIAVRFLWLSIFCLLLLGYWLRDPIARSLRWQTRVAWISAISALALIPAFWSFGDWPMISRALPQPLADFSRPYPAEKYYGHAVWMLRDAGLEGHLYNRYTMGGFMSFWLSPKLKMSSSGSLNIARESFDAQLALARRAGLDSSETFTQRLDREGIDLFLGIGLPVMPAPNRPATYTTAHLEGTEGWIPIFRNLDSAIYLRVNERNRTNLDRVTAYYRSAGVPFDPEVGFDAKAAIEATPRWAVDHGVVPVDFGSLLEAERLTLRGSPPDARSAPQLDRLASIYASLGLYQQMLLTNRLIRDASPRYPAAARREIWARLRLRKLGAAANSARAAATFATPNSLLEYIARNAIEMAGRTRSDRRASTALLPLLTPDEGNQVVAGYRRPPSRSTSDVANETIPETADRG